MFVQTTNFCKDVTIQFQSVSNRIHWVEVGWYRLPYSWEPQGTNNQIGIWRIASEPIVGTGGVMTWRAGVPYGASLFRVGQE
mgnify:CR=1 FL=1